MSAIAFPTALNLFRTMDGWMDDGSGGEIEIYRNSKIDPEIKERTRDRERERDRYVDR